MSVLTAIYPNLKIEDFQLLQAGERAQTRLSSMEQAHSRRISNHLPVEYYILVKISWIFEFKRFEPRTVSVEDR